MRVQSAVTNIGWFVCQSVDHDHKSYKTAEPIEVLFGIWTQKGPRNHVLGGDPDPRRGRGNFWGRHLLAHYEVQAVLACSQYSQLNSLGGNRDAAYSICIYSICLYCSKLLSLLLAQKFAFSALTLLVGQQEGHLACKKT